MPKNLVASALRTAKSVAAKPAAYPKKVVTTAANKAVQKIPMFKKQASIPEAITKVAQERIYKLAMEDDSCDSKEMGEKGKDKKEKGGEKLDRKAAFKKMMMERKGK